MELKISMWLELKMVLWLGAIIYGLKMLMWLGNHHFSLELEILLWLGHPSSCTLRTIVAHILT